MSVIQEVLNSLPHKVVSTEGCNHYLTIKADDIEGGFLAYYENKVNNKRVSERWFHEEETEPKYKIDEIKCELQKYGFKVLLLDFKRGKGKDLANI